MMTKKELKTGDIIVTRAGYLGVVLKDEEYILYQEIGMDLLDEFNDDLTFADPDYSNGDVMHVYRGCSFIDLDDNDPYWEREENWKRPTEEERYAREAMEEEMRQAVLELLRGENTEKAVLNGVGEDRILIVSQAYYGNRTETDIRRQNIDNFILGYQSDKTKIMEPIDRTILRIPDTDNLVMIYNKFMEEEHLLKKAELLEKENYHLKPLAVIPELGIELYSRCIVCRMNENGEFDSLQDEDYEKFMKYLAP